MQAFGVGDNLIVARRNERVKPFEQFPPRFRLIERQQQIGGGNAPQIEQFGSRRAFDAFGRLLDAARKFLSRFDLMRLQPQVVTTLQNSRA